MAKLNGVKTLDMVNGEITKVAYGGAEYVKTEGDAQVGDVVFVTESWGDQNVGEFFVVTYTTSGIRDQIVGMDGNICEASTYKHRLRIFRKVSASTGPSLEERVSSAEGEIESLKFEIYRKVSATSVEAERLKVGDYAKVVNATDYHRFTDGDIVEIIGDRFGAPTNELSRRLTDGKNQYVPKRQLVRATDEEVAEAKDAAARAKFKRGAKVRLLSGGGKFPLSGFENGKVYEVLYNNFNHPKGKRIRIADDAERFGYATPDQLEILTEEEAAEIERQQAEEAKWAKIGRKVGEYRVGDIVNTEYYGVFEVTEIDRGSEHPIRGKMKGYESGMMIEGVTLVTPVEARFDR